MKSAPKIIHFKVMGDERGSLVALEGGGQIPFDIKRVYYIWGTLEGVVRGKHAHKELRQVLICVRGSVDIYCEYGHKKETYHLNNPALGLELDGLVWHEMRNFSKDAVLIVLASEHYDEADYIRDYQEFLGEKEGMIHAEEGIQRRSRRTANIRSRLF